MGCGEPPEERWRGFGRFTDVHTRPGSVGGLLQLTSRGPRGPTVAHRRDAHRRRGRQGRAVGVSRVDGTEGSQVAGPGLVLVRSPRGEVETRR